MNMQHTCKSVTYCIHKISQLSLMVGPTVS